MSVSPSPVPSPAIGEQLTLSLNITDGENVAGYQATVQFDTAALRYMESANGDYLKAGAFFVPPVVKGNRVTLASSAIASVNNRDGTLANITFEVVAVKASAVPLSQVALVDPDGELSFPQIENGEVTEPPQLVGDVNDDGVVNIQELVLVGANFGKTGENNGDGVVNIVDLVKVAGVFGTTAAPPALHLVGNNDRYSPLTATDVQGWLTQSPEVKPHRCNGAPGDYRPRAPLGSLDPKRDHPIAQLPQPVQPRNVDTVPPHPRRRCHTHDL